MKLHFLFATVLSSLCVAQQVTAPPLAGEKILAPNRLETRNVTVKPVTYLGRTALSVVDSGAEDLGDGGRLAVIRDSTFRDGVTEADLSGDTAATAPPEYRGFVGIAFRVSSDTSRFECFYLRPKNGRSNDQLQRNHSAQYISLPGSPWQKLRSESPGKYESYVDLVPGQWTHIKIEVQGTTARLFVNRAEQPTLIVDGLKQPPNLGGIALWVGPGTIAHFTDVQIHQKY